MAVRSYVDLAFFICVMHADPADVPASLRTTFETGSDCSLQRQLADRARSLLNKDTYLHECIHLWQGLNLPFVYWSSFRAFQGVLKTFRALDHTFPDLHDWQGRTPGILRLLSEKLHPYVSTHCVELHMRDKGQIAGYQQLPPFSPLSLLETAVSVTQWKLLRSTMPSPAVSFSRWSKREGGYRVMIDYLTRLVGDEELALDMYLPLCNAAFCTLNPVSAFVTGAYQYVAKHKPDLRVATNTYRNRIKRIFDETTQHLPNSERFRAPRQLSELEVSLVDLPPLKLTMREVVDITFGESRWPHPTLHTLAKRWIGEATTQPEMRNLLDDPTQTSDTTIEHLLDTYQPMILVRYASPTRTRAVPVLREGDYDYVERIERVAPGVHGPTALRDLYTMFGAARRAVGIYYDESTRLCSHKACREYSFNYCNTWMFIPERHQDCKFRDNITYIRTSIRQLEEKERGAQDSPHRCR